MAAIDTPAGNGPKRKLLAIEGGGICGISPSKS